MYLYESHMGGFFATDTKLDTELLYCDQCGESDDYIGEANYFGDAWMLLRPLTALTDVESGKYSSGYVKEFLTQHFDVPSETRISNREALELYCSDRLLAWMLLDKEYWREDGSESGCEYFVTSDGKRFWKYQDAIDHEKEWLRKPFFESLNLSKKEETK